MALAECLRCMYMPPLLLAVDRSQEFKLPWPTSNRPCAKCPCNVTDMPWTDVSDHACWMPHVWTDHAWRVQFPNHHPIFDVPGVTVKMVMFDLLHVKHLGTDSYFFGSVLWLLCYELLPNDPANNLQYVFDRCLDYWDRESVSNHYNHIKLSMFVKENDFPRLKGRGAEIKAMAHPLVEIWEMWMDDTVDEHAFVYEGLRMSARMENILSANVRCSRLPPAAAHEFKECAFAFLAVQTAAAQIYNTRVPNPLFLFDVTIKSHCLAHVGLECLFMNPRMGWNYTGEHYVSRMKVVASSCCKGNRPDQSQRKMIAKYRQGFHYSIVSDMWSHH